MKKPYKLIDHTGDAGAVIYGKTMDEIFTNAAVAMTDILIDRNTVDKKLSTSMEVRGEDIEDLLVRWLSEINYRLSTESEIYSEYLVERLTDKRLRASAIGDKLDPEKHKLKAEIKAVTYHRLYIKETSYGFEAQVIFDL